MSRKIYDLNNGKIEVYSFRPLEHKLRLFRIQELDYFLPSERVLKKENTRSWFTPTKGVVYECDSYILRLLKYASKEDRREGPKLIREYIEGAYRSDPVIINDTLITLSPKNNTTNKRIQLTDEAYYAYLLDNEDFTSSYLQEGNLEDLKEVFKLSRNPIEEVSIDDFRRMYSSDLIEGDYEEKMDYLEKSSKVFRKIR
ncbi:MAG: hypothetical protein IJ193_03250 [Bacilli bacterium]|nr:hypothetical protein [Bacilli bacterium]